jgi:hypothetical protein
MITLLIKLLKKLQYLFVIHDKDDLEVPVKAAQHIYDHLKMVNSY